ncbi:PAS domain S-box protein [Rhizobium leguminosarum]|uniref:hybrid sensor histidine kinase/response regulator n=1 Tax=Rhizobium leguminosarum TaxID=384 RepID=UPI001C94438E|nr:PAS domain-containing sensor histidine kinase [Rhizobium leguminosarum]MBY5369147.1 PAS domain S-box protein [Rhizobium leguminosarum]MBY5452143.1 PAS domain S-box protein [Rhizobium leguminosarum]
MPHRLVSPRTASYQELDVMVHVLDGADILIHRFEGTISHWSIGCENMYGWTRDEAVGENVYELLATRFPEPVDEIRNQIKQRGFWQGEIIHRHKSGHEIHAASRCVLVNLPDGDLAIIQTNSDVSALKQAQDAVKSREAHLSSILDTVPDAMVVIDHKGMVLSFSKAAEKLFGMASDQICGRNVRNLMPNPYRDAHDGYIGHYIETGEKRIIGYGRVVTGQRADGTQFPMELHVGEATANGERIFTGFVRDLTSRFKIEEDLRQAQKMEAVGQLTGGLAHDFNNLLTVISGNLEMIEDKLPPGKLRDILREAQDAAADGAKLTGQLLAFGRRQPLNPKHADLGQLVTGFSDLLRRTLGEDIKLSTTIAGSDLNVVVDSSQLQNAILNIALNARDAMPKGGSLTTEISRVHLDSDYAKMYPEVRSGNFVLISVTDTGVGMTDEVTKHAIEPFFTTKEVGSGTGLGLSMVYGFVKQSGGHFQIYSEVGRGTTIRIYLPALTGSKLQKPVSEDGKQANPLQRGSESILVVEDDPRVRRVAVARLADMGYVVLEAENGREALGILRDHQEIALLFTDIVMPGGMTGDEVAREARLLRPDVAVLFTSGYSEPALATTDVISGARWLRKPYTARELASMIRELFDRH